jgi:hypothetical protein
LLVMDTGRERRNERGLARSSRNYRNHVFLFPSLNIQVQRSTISSTHSSESEEAYIECFVGLVPTIVLSGHSLNLA